MNLRLMFLLSCAAALPAQRTLEYDRSVVSQVRIDARDLGYPPADMIPPDESAISALAIAPGGDLYGVTGGKRSHLFVLHPLHGYVQPLGFLTGTSPMHHALVVSKTGDVYTGSTRLLRYTPAGQDRQAIRIDAACPMADLGTPVAGESVYALAIDRDRGKIYGISHPNGWFFGYDIAAAEFKQYGRLAERGIPGEKFEKEKLLGRALAVDRKGNVFASGEGGALFRFDAGTQKLEKLRLTAPTVPGREVYNRVDAWATDPSGRLFGGTSDGYLFRLDPVALRLDNLGKPLNQYRVRGLVWGRNGKLYGVGGDDEEMASLFSYEPARGAYELLGMIDVNRRPYYSWQAYRIGAMAIGADGTIYIGQAERKSKLYLYYPE